MRMQLWVTGQRWSESVTTGWYCEVRQHTVLEGRPAVDWRRRGQLMVAKNAVIWIR
ncbi:hypothetical protein [Dactylosporangium sp. NPDC000521]|uniref:hypothetical protein n=1 Tax=Dactylosporangium sp. NPDC000521 TaxID=3363975 RepID=UPI0036839B14